VFVVLLGLVALRGAVRGVANRVFEHNLTQMLGDVSHQKVCGRHDVLLTIEEQVEFLVAGENKKKEIFGLGVDRWEAFSRMYKDQPEELAKVDCFNCSTCGRVHPKRDHAA